MPSYARQQVQDALTRTGQASHTQLQPVMQNVPTHDAPPTHFRTNKFTHCFQTIVDAYGIARYREVRRSLAFPSLSFLLRPAAPVGRALSESGSCAPQDAPALLAPSPQAHPPELPSNPTCCASPPPNRFPTAPQP